MIKDDLSCISESISNKMYHVSLFFNRNSILSKGLDYSGVTLWPEDKYPSGNYLFPNIKNARKYGFENSDPFDIWEVNVEGLLLEKDPITENCFFTKSIIPKNKINLSESHINDVVNSFIFKKLK